jgi:hypothetical protein
MPRRRSNLPGKLVLLVLALATSPWLPGGRSARADELPASGQKKCWNAAGASVPCAGTHQDGELRAGQPLALVNNGDGTVTDLNTRLVWEKLSRDGSIHDYGSTSTWGQALGGKIAQLDGNPCFASSCTWRLPNAKELQSIVDFQRAAPALAKAFVKKCKPGCDGIACSCTPAQTMNGAAGFWSSTSNVAAPAEAWQLLHASGALGSVAKTALGSVRAVRSLDPCTKATARVSTSYVSGASPVSGVITDVTYPESMASLPGFGSEPSVLARVANLSGVTGGLFNARDDDTAVEIGLVSLGQAIAPGAFADVTFDCVPGAPAPTISDFSCSATVSDLDGKDVAATCSVSAVRTQ